MNSTDSTAEQKLKHTPGPWEVDPGDAGDSSVGLAPTATTVFVNVPNDDKFRIVEIARILPTTYGNNEEGDPLSWGDADANALLIAAAPRLLSALKLVRPVIEKETKRWLAEALRERNEETEGKVDGAMSFLEEIDAAIANAEGSVTKHESAQPCGCDPGANWKCEAHR
jgi:hypothetical protein